MALEKFLDRFTKYRQDPIEFDIPGVRLLGNPYYSQLIEGEFHALDYSGTLTGTHKDGAAKTLVEHAIKKKQDGVIFYSAGSHDKAVMTKAVMEGESGTLDKILGEGNNLLLFQLVDQKGQRAEVLERGYLTRIILGGDHAHKVYVIPVDFNGEVYNKKEREQLVQKRIKEKPELQKAVGLDWTFAHTKLPWERGLKLMDITNPHETLPGDKPIYQFDSDFLAQYDCITVPVGTENLFYSIQSEINKLPDSERPTLIGVVPELHPSVVRKEDHPRLQQMQNEANARRKKSDIRLGKLETPVVYDTAKYVEKNFSEGKDWFFTPDQNAINETYEEVMAMATKQKNKRENRFHKLNPTFDFEKRLSLFPHWKYTGYSTNKGGIVFPGVEETSMAALTPFRTEYKISSGLLIPNMHGRCYDPEVQGWMIPKGSKVLAIMTGKSKEFSEIKDMAKVYRARNGKK